MVLFGLLLPPHSLNFEFLLSHRFIVNQLLQLAFADLCTVQAYFLELLLPVLVGHLFGFLQDFWLELRVGVLLLEFTWVLLLLVPVDMHFSEMLLHW